eukprot:3303640-Rhodomonas_salina.4
MQQGNVPHPAQSLSFCGARTHLASAAQRGVAELNQLRVLHALALAEPRQDLLEMHEVDLPVVSTIALSVWKQTVSFLSVLFTGTGTW